MRRSTLMLGPSSFYRWNAGKIPLFLPPPFFLFYFVSSPSLLFASPSFLLFFFLSFSPFLIHRTSFLLFAPISFSHFLISHFSLISLIFSFLSFSLLFLFLLFLFSISHLDCINRMVQKWGKLPPSFLHCHLSSPPFFS